MAGRAVLRDVGCQLGELVRADGSARFRQGNTEVLCSLTGPLEAPERLSECDRAVIEVVTKGRDRAVRSGGATKVVMGMERYDESLSTSELSHMVRGCMEAVLDTAALPRQRLLFTVQVLEDDGSLASVCVNAAMLALLDSGLPCVAALAASEACTVDEKLVLDPSTADREKAEATAFFVHLTDEEGGLVASKYVEACKASKWFSLGSHTHTHTHTAPPAPPWTATYTGSSTAPAAALRPLSAHYSGSS